MTGDPDYVLKAVLPGLPELAILLNEVLLPSESVAQVRSSLVLECIKETGGLAPRLAAPTVLHALIPCLPPWNHP